MSIESPYLTVAEVAVYLNLSPKTVYAWAERGLLLGHKVGRLWRFHKDEIEGFVRGVRDTRAGISGARS